jgi:hypothetical protein
MAHICNVRLPVPAENFFLGMIIYSRSTLLQPDFDSIELRRVLRQIRAGDHAAVAKDVRVAGYRLP